MNVVMLRSAIALWDFQEQFMECIIVARSTVDRTTSRTANSRTLVNDTIEINRSNYP